MYLYIRHYCLLFLSRIQEHLIRSRQVYREKWPNARFNQIIKFYLCDVIKPFRKIAVQKKKLLASIEQPMCVFALRWKGMRKFPWRQKFNFGITTCCPTFRIHAPHAMLVICRSNYVDKCRSHYSHKNPSYNTLFEHRLPISYWPKEQ